MYVYILYSTVNWSNFADDILKTIMRNQLIFKFKLRTIEEKQDVIIKMLEDQANKQIFSNGDNSLIDYNPMADLYPIESLDDLNKIEAQILLDTEYRKKIVSDNICIILCLTIC